jgi:hypothetical protein
MAGPRVTRIRRAAGPAGLFRHLDPLRLLSQHSEARHWALLMLLPSVVIIGAIVLYPTPYGIGLSFREMRLTRPDLGTGLVGLKHYRARLADEVFGIALRNTALWVAIAVGLELAFGLASALALNRRRRWLGRHGQELMRRMQVGRARLLELAADIVVILFVLFSTLPILWLFLTSLKPEEQIVTKSIRYLPDRITLEHGALTLRGSPPTLRGRGAFQHPPSAQPFTRRHASRPASALRLPRQDRLDDVRCETDQRQLPADIADHHSRLLSEFEDRATMSGAPEERQPQRACRLRSSVRDQQPAG